MKESIENKLEITLFSYKIVQAAMNFFRGLEIPEKILKKNFSTFCEFADYYSMEDLKVNLD